MLKESQRKFLEYANTGATLNTQSQADRIAIKKHLDMSGITVHVIVKSLQRLGLINDQGQITEAGRAYINPPPLPE